MEEKNNNSKVLIIVFSIIGGIILLGLIALAVVVLAWGNIQKAVNKQWEEVIEEVNNNQTSNDITNELEENDYDIPTDTNLEKTIDGKAVVYLFRGEGCPHCTDAENWLESIKEEYGKYFTVVDYETWYNEDNAEFMKKVAKSRGENVQGVPYIIIGNKSWNGFTESYEDEMLKEIGRVSTISE